MNRDQAELVFKLSRELLMLMSDITDGECFACGGTRATRHTNNFVVYARERNGIKFNICNHCSNGLWHHLNHRKPEDCASKWWFAFKVEGNFDIVPDDIFAGWMANKLFKSARFRVRARA